MSLRPDIVGTRRDSNSARRRHYSGAAGLFTMGKHNDTYFFFTRHELQTPEHRLQNVAQRTRTELQPDLKQTE